MKKKFLTSVVLTSSLCAAILVSNKCFALTEAERQAFQERWRDREEREDLISQDIEGKVREEVRKQRLELEKYYKGDELDRMVNEQGRQVRGKLLNVVRTLLAKKDRIELSWNMAANRLNRAQEKVVQAQKQFAAARGDYDVELARVNLDNADAELKAAFEQFRAISKEYEIFYRKQCESIEGDRAFSYFSKFYDATLSKKQNKAYKRCEEFLSEQKRLRQPIPAEEDSELDFDTFLITEGYPEY